jgi:hypothetical protein
LWLRGRIHGRDLKPPGALVSEQQHPAFAKRAVDGD